MRADLHLAVIPFQGFYNTWHEQMLDDELEQIFWDENGDANYGLVNRAHMYIDWRHAQEQYAKAFVSVWADHAELEGVVFDELNSPREYNFVTDRIFVRLPTSEVQRMFEESSVESLTQVATEMFTSRSGFISFYDSNWRMWGEPDEWDHNQVYALIRAYLRTKGLELGDGYDEAQLMGGYRDNGYFENWLLERQSEELTRLLRIQDYLRQREERNVVTLQFR